MKYYMIGSPGPQHSELGMLDWNFGGRRDLHGFVKISEDAKDIDTFGERDKLAEGSEGIAGSLSAMGEDKSVNEFIKPCVLYFKCLLLLQQVCCKAPW
jgi:hypothetical protein